MKKILYSILLAYVCFILVGCTNSDLKNEENYYITGDIIEIYPDINGSFLVSKKDGTDNIIVHHNSDLVFELGQEVKVKYDGIVNDSFPPQVIAIDVQIIKNMSATFISVYKNPKEKDIVRDNDHNIKSVKGTSYLKIANEKEIKTIEDAIKNSRIVEKNEYFSDDVDYSNYIYIIDIVKEETHEIYVLILGDDITKAELSKSSDKKYCECSEVDTNNLKELILNK